MTTTVYTNHRENQREKILEVAEELFIENGIGPVNMGEIARASRLTRATIYKYFPNKEQIALEIFKTVLRGWNERNAQDVWGVAGTGFQRLEKFLFSFFGYYCKNPREARFFSEFLSLWGKELPVGIVTEIVAATLEEDKGFILACIHQGIQDGTLRKDIDPSLILDSIFNFNSAILSRMGQMGDKLEGEYRRSSQEIFDTISRFFLDGLKAQPSKLP
jgi:AcrR family transcriptional regulator